MTDHLHNLEEALAIAALYDHMQTYDPRPKDPCHDPVYTEYAIEYGIRAADFHQRIGMLHTEYIRRHDGAA